MVYELFEGAAEIVSWDLKIPKFRILELQKPRISKNFRIFRIPESLKALELQKPSAPEAQNFQNL